MLSTIVNFFLLSDLKYIPHYFLIIAPEWEFTLVWYSTDISLFCLMGNLEEAFLLQIRVEEKLSSEE